MSGKMSFKAAIGVVVVAAVLIAVVVGVLQQRTEKGAVQIAGMYSQTGEGASFAADIKKAVDLAVEEVSDGGGIGGRRLEVIVEDTQSEARNAVSAFEKVIAESRVPAAVGFITSSEAMACAPVAERAKVVMITPIAGIPMS